MELHMHFYYCFYAYFKLDIQHKLVTVQRIQVEGFPRHNDGSVSTPAWEISVFAERLPMQCKRLYERLLIPSIHVIGKDEDIVY